MKQIASGRATAALFVISLFGRALNAESASAEQLHIPATPRTIEELITLDVVGTSRTLQSLIDQGWGSLEAKPNDPVDLQLAKSQRIFALNDAVRQQLEAFWPLRVEIGRDPDPGRARQAAKVFLETASEWIEFTGRLRYLTREHTRQVISRVPRDRSTELIRMARQHRVGSIASSLAFVLVTPPPGSKATPFDQGTREVLLNLIQETRDVDSIPSLGALIRWPHTPPTLALHIAETLQSVGVVGSVQEGKLNVDRLRERLAAIDSGSLNEDLRKRQTALLDWLDMKSDPENDIPRFRWGNVDLHPGDWILQRNPSPYNRFTDLSPGLFTHVGVVASVERNGTPQIMIVDLPETGTRIRAETPDEFVAESLHWMVLRHRDAETAEKMGRVAGALIGRPSEFDLTFDMSLVAKQRGLLNAQGSVRTYCAGFLALCAQEAGVDREEVFPLIERAANATCAANLRSIGMDVTEFVSPSGPLFSPALEIVGSRMPMYDETNFIMEAVYDRFAEQLRQQAFHPRQSNAQRLRQELAELGSEYAWVRNALAKASNVNPGIDLVVAARIATIVENLDRIADANAEAYFDAYDLIRAGGVPRDVTGDQKVRMTKLLSTIQKEHPQWITDRQAGRLPTLSLRQLLANHYAKVGARQVDAMFFDTAKSR